MKSKTSQFRLVNVLRRDEPMRKYSVHACWLLTYSVSGTSLSGGKTEFSGMAASGGDYGAPYRGGGGPGFYPVGGVLCY